MQIEIEGADAIKVAQDIVEMEGVQGSYEVISEVEREGTLATIAVLIVSKNGDRLMLKDATLEQLQKLLEQEKSQQF